MSAERESLLRKVLYDIAKERNYDNPEFQVTVLPPTGQNFTSQLFHVTISAPERENLKLFAKVSVVAEAVRKEVPSKIFDIEQHVYTKLLKSYEEIQDKHNVPAEHRLVVPKFYGCNDTFLEEVLVLQDLTADGFTTYNRLKSIDWEYASKAVEEMAKMHALSIAYQKEYPEDYEEAIKVLKREMTESPQLMAGMQQVVVKVLETVKEENRGKLMKFLLEGFDPSKFQEFYQPRRRPVIIHSDFRQSNLMHKRREDGSLQVVVVDYQTMHSGCVALDLMYFIFTGSDGAFRKEHYTGLIEHYFTTITAALKRLDLNPEEVFPREDFDQDLKEMLPFGLIVSGMMLPMITLDMANVPESGENESIEGMMEMLSNTNELCARLLNEVVDDYVAWGVL